MIWKYGPFLRNIDVFSYMNKKLLFQSEFKCRFFLEMLIFTDLLTKIIFSKFSQKTSYSSSDVKINVLFSKYCYFLRWNLKKSTFFANFDIFGDIGKKWIFQNDLKKTAFSRNVDIGHSELESHSKTSTYYDESWKYEGWQALV